MDGLFVVIAILIGIANFAAKQQKNQANRGRQHNPGGQNPVHKPKYVPESLKKTIMDMENIWNDGLKGMTENKPVSMREDEGIELEDRRNAGSIEYIEQSQSTEGECDEHPDHDLRNRDGKAAAYQIDTVEDGTDYVIDLTEENMIKSIVMSEILGPPRALKRRIR